MKHLGLVHITLILVAGALLIGAAAGGNGLTAYQSLMPSSAEVGQMANVIVSLTNNGQNPIPATVTPRLPPGVVANMGGQSLELYPGQTQQVSYPITAQQSGSYWITSVISYSEDGYPYSLMYDSPFTATESVSSPQPGQIAPAAENPGSFPGPGREPVPDYPGPADPYGSEPPEGEMPGDDLPPGISGFNHSGEPPAEQQPGGIDGPAGPTG
ncbi:MAG TPA: hypothetical protein PK602_06485 [Methanothrix sp.]|nr:hypothetical protein [Methanothrix sp.]HQQ37733.1 hypothetical protein [Methanothrix sp.]